MTKRKKKITQTDLLDVPEIPVFVKLEIEGKHSDEISPFAFLNIFNNVDIECDRNSLKRTLENMNLQEGQKIQTYSGDEYLIKTVKMIEKEDPHAKTPVKWIIFTLSQQ